MKAARMALTVVIVPVALLALLGLFESSEHWRDCVARAERHARWGRLASGEEKAGCATGFLIALRKDALEHGIADVPGPFDDFWGEVLAYHHRARRLYEWTAYQPWRPIPDESPYPQPR